MQKIGRLLGVAALSWLAGWWTISSLAQTPLHRLKIRLVDGATNKPISARVSIIGSDNQSYAPQNALLRKLVDGETYFYAAGEFVVELPAGAAHVEIVRGLEYLPEVLDINVGTTGDVTARLGRWTNMAERGWYSGDSHVHLHTGGPLMVDVQDALLAARAEDLNYTNLCVSNNMGDDIRDADLITGKPHELSDATHLLVFGEEMRSSIYGHMQFFGIRKLVEPQYTGFDDTPHHHDYPPNYDQADQAIRQGGIVTYGHPLFTNQPDPFAPNPLEHNAAARELPIDAILGKTQAVDLMCYGSDEQLSTQLWYRLLNCGLRLAACAGTDALLDRSTNPLGGDRVYVKVNGDFAMQSWLDSLKAGRTFVTNGPMVTFTVDGKEAGQTMVFERPEAVRVRAEIESYVPVEVIEIIVNGQVAFSTAGTASTSPQGVARQQIDREIPVQASSWIALRVRGPQHRYVLDGPAWAHTSPVFITVGGRPITSREDAGYFVEWIDKLLDVVAQRNRYAKPEERQRVEQLFRQAQAHFKAMAAGDGT